jgi:hypothetical protein
VVAPCEQLKFATTLLPDKSTRITVYDQTGGDDSDAMAAWLRQQGWGLARQLRGGFAEWLENDEEVQPIAEVEGAKWKVGDRVKIKGGDPGWVQAIEQGPRTPRYTIYVEGKEPVGPLTASKLSASRS